MRGGLAAVLVAAFMLALSWLFNRPIPQENEQLVTYMLGALQTFAGGAVAYYFATSKSSSDKNALIDRDPHEEVDPTPLPKGRDLPGPEFPTGED